MAERQAVELCLLRHAHAGNPAAWSGPDDARPLSAKGERQAERLGEFLAGVGFAPDAIVTSPKVRARQTAEIVASHLGVAVAVDDRLGGALDLAAIEAILVELHGPRRPLLVGHDPDFTEIVSTLVEAAEIPLRKGALARIDALRPLEPGGGVLRWLVPPDLLRD